jgi:uncharacterized Ntn-hydrolase superfamily protein
VTYSIAGYCQRTGQVGFAMASFDVNFVPPARSPSCVEAGAGAVACQAMTFPGAGDRIMELLAAGAAPGEALIAALEGEPAREFAQIGVVDAAGAVAAFTGARTMPWCGDLPGERCIAAGNLLRGGGVLEAMVHAFEWDDAAGLPRRLFIALDAGLRAGGDRRGTRAATLRVAGPPSGDLFLRVQHHRRPLAELARLLDVAESEGGFTRLVGRAATVFSPLLGDPQLVAELAQLTTDEAVARLRDDPRALGLAPEAPAILDKVGACFGGPQAGLREVPFAVTLAALRGGLISAS